MCLVFITPVHISLIVVLITESHHINVQLFNIVFNSIYFIVVYNQISAQSSNTSLCSLDCTYTILHECQLHRDVYFYFAKTFTYFIPINPPLSKPIFFMI